MPAKNKLLAVALFAILGLGFGTTPWAAPTGAALSEAEEDRLLQSSISRAKERLALSNPAEALAILIETYGRVPTPALLWPIVDLQLRLSHPKEARSALDKYVAQVPPSKMPKGQQLADVERLRAELHKQLASLELVGVAPDATVSVDGEELDAAALTKPIEVNPGRHRVESRQSGQNGPNGQNGQNGRSIVREVSVQAGQALRVELLAALSTGGEDLDGATGKRRRQPVRTAAYVLGGIGIAGIVVGSVLWGLDGMQSCPQAPMCRYALDSKTAGVGLLSAGIGLGSAALVLGILDFRSSQRK